MKIGIFFDDVTPEKGGASSLLITIEQEIKKIQCKYDIVICYNGSSRKPYKTELDGMTYINVDKCRISSIPKMFFKNAGNALRNIGLRLFYHPVRPYRESFLDYLAEKEDIDLFWFTYPIDVDTTVPYIYTVWDVGHRVMPAFPEVGKPAYLWNEREEHYLRMLKKATFVITGNETGKKELVENYPISKDKIRIVPFPISSFCYGEEKRPDIELPEEYFFYPAQFWPHKNHICIVKAIAYLREKYGVDKHVVFTGSDKGNKSYVQKMANKLGMSDLVHFPGFMSYEEIKYLYRHAQAIVYASLMGPNNIPPMEAVYLECPVIISDVPGHVEQFGEAVTYFDRYDPEDLAEKMLGLDVAMAIKKQAFKRKELMEYSYSERLLPILNDFSKMLETWKD